MLTHSLASMCIQRLHCQWACQINGAYGHSRYLVARRIEQVDMCESELSGSGGGVAPETEAEPPLREPILGSATCFGGAEETDRFVLPIGLLTVLGLIDRRGPRPALFRRETEKRAPHTLERGASTGRAG